MRRGQKVHRCYCPGCGKSVAYSVDGLTHQFAHLRRHNRPDGLPCDRTSAWRNVASWRPATEGTGEMSDNEGAQQ